MFSNSNRKPRSDRGKRRVPPRNEIHVQARINASRDDGTQDPRKRDAVEFWRKKRRAEKAAAIVTEALLALREKEERGYTPPVATSVQMHAATVEVFEQMRGLMQRLQSIDLSGASMGARQAVEHVQRDASQIVNAVNLIGAVAIADDDEDEGWR